MPPSKVCAKCKEEKPLTGFYPDVRRKSGLHSYCRTCSAIQNRRRTLRRKFGLTPETFEARLEAQGHGCAICGSLVPGGVGRFHVDHDHGTQVTRGILCRSCNVGIGHLKDSPAVLGSALRYLHAHGKALSSDDLGELFAALDVHHSGETNESPDSRLRDERLPEQA